VNKSFWKQVLRDNWYGLAALGLMGAALLYGLARSGSTPEAAHPAVAVASAVEGAAETVTLMADRPTEADKARGIIAEHQAKLDADPRSPDAPAFLDAMANLYRQRMGDYVNAAQCYERLLIDYPQWEGIQRVYAQLATCYERSGDSSNAQRVYKKMMDVFPPESQECLYAKAKLGLK
jgi:tetratricopeptide (TPR) repeat protein